MKKSTRNPIKIILRAILMSAFVPYFALLIAPFMWVISDDMTFWEAQVESFNEAISMCSGMNWKI